MTTDALLVEVDRLAGECARLNMNRADAAHIRAEYAHVLRLIRYGTLRLQHAAAGIRLSADEERALIDDLVAEHDRVWLLRNRIGGMDDSADNLRFRPDGC